MGSYSTIDVRQRAMKALERGVAIGQVALSYGIDRTTVYRWSCRYEENGAVGLRRATGSGRPRKFEELDSIELLNILLKPATEFGFETDLWTIARLRRVVVDEFAAKLSKNTIWRRVREAGLTYQKPERVYFEIDEAARQKWLRVEVPKIRRTVRKYKAILYFQDESNISLSAFLGETWSPEGKTPKVRGTGNRGGVAAMSALSPKGSLLFNLLDKRINSEDVIHFLKQMLKHHSRRHLVVVMDRARPHTSRKMQEFIASQSRLHVFYLPKYSPDWNPDEKVWNHLKHQELKSHQAKTTAELTSLTKRKLKSMARNPQLLRGIYFRCCVANFFE